MNLISTATFLLCERQITDWEEEGLAKHLKKVQREGWKGQAKLNIKNRVIQRANEKEMSRYF